MQQPARFVVQHATPGRGRYVSPVRAVERIRIHVRARRSRSDLLPLYVAAGVAGAVCGFLLSVL